MYCTAGAVHNFFQKLSQPRSEGSRRITQQVRCSKNFFQKLSQTTSVFDQKPPFFWSKTPKPSKSFFQKLSQTMKNLVHLVKTNRVRCLLVLYSIIRNIAVRCSTNQNLRFKIFFQKVSHTLLGVVNVLHRRRGAQIFFRKLSQRQ